MPEFNITFWFWERYLAQLHIYLSTLNPPPFYIKRTRPHCCRANLRQGQALCGPHRSADQTPQRLPAAQHVQNRPQDVQRALRSARVKLPPSPARTRTKAGPPRPAQRQNSGTRAPVHRGQAGADRDAGKDDL